MAGEMARSRSGRELIGGPWAIRRRQRFRGSVTGAPVTTRKGSMRARSFIVRGKGNPASLGVGSHGAGRAMSRTEARRRFTVDDHILATRGVECRKDAEVIDEPRWPTRTSTR